MSVTSFDELTGSPEVKKTPTVDKRKWQKRRIRLDVEHGKKVKVLVYLAGNPVTWDEASSLKEAVKLVHGHFLTNERLKRDRLAREEAERAKKKKKTKQVTPTLEVEEDDDHST